MKTKKYLVWVLGLMAAALLCGCGFSQSAEELFSLPQIPEEYQALTEQLNVLLNDGYNYIAPTAGDNIQSLQMRDLDGDGMAEAVAFFSRESDEENLKIAIFQCVDGLYRRICTIEQAGTSVERVYYEDLTGDGKAELIVGRVDAADNKTVTVYNVGRDCLPLVECSYTHITIADVDQDGQPSLVVLHNDRDSQPVVEFYGWQSDILTLSYRGILSSTMEQISRGGLSYGSCYVGVPALFITGVTIGNQAVTDILVWDAQDGLFNLLTDEKTGKTTVKYAYNGLLPQDINSDSVTEFPEVLCDGEDGSVAWTQYDGDGNFRQVEETYHCQKNGWYLTLPGSWWGRVTGDYFADSSEEQVTLMLDGTPVLSLFSISGDGRENRAVMGNRFVVKRQTGKVFSAELYDLGSKNGMDEDLLRHSFHLTQESWAADNR